MEKSQVAGSSIRSKRYSDRVGFSSKGSIARTAFLLACFLIVLASASLAFIGLVSSKEADRQAFTSQQILLDLAITNRFSLIARDQLSLARWDDSVLNISRNFNQDFVVDEFIDSLWFDFGLERNVIVDPDNLVIVEAIAEDVDFAKRQMASTDPLLSLVEQARKSYLKHRTDLPGGFGQHIVSPAAAESEIAHGFLRLDDKVVMASAMAIVPDDGAYALPEGNPFILVSAIDLGEVLITDLNSQLSFSNLEFYQGKDLSSVHSSREIFSTAGELLGSFSWESAMPGQHIWRTVVPVVIVLGALLAIVALGIAWKIGHLTLSLAASEQHNFYLAMHDPLSGLANRLQFNRALEAAVQKVDNSPITLIQCDLDLFKKVNDTLGHAAGDSVIRSVARRLSNRVADAGLVGRIGGDEFVILLGDCADYRWVKDLADMIIADICRPIETGKNEFAEIGISLGIAFGPADGTSSETLMAAADKALYAAKKLGRNRAIFAEPDKHSGIRA